MKRSGEFSHLQAGLSRKYAALALVWSALVIGSLLWDMRQSSTHALSIAAAAARADIGKDLIFRRWATSHGGVYVPPTEHTPPNPYLKVPDRDVTTTSGKQLTLMNPAYMLREMQNDFPNEYGTRSHITSLKLLNPKNAPDAWETAALRAFEQGEKERVETEQIDGQSYLRMMRPLIAEKGCLKCHGFQGYKEGDIRGGLSTMIPLAPFLAGENEQNTDQILTHGVIWLIGLTGLGFSYRRERRQFGKYEEAEEQLRSSSLYTRSLIEASLDPLVTISPEGKITDVNEATEKATGRNRAELVGTDFSDYFTEPDKALAGYQQVFREGSVTDYPLAIRHTDGHVTDVLYNASLYRDENGSVLGVFAAARDVTGRKLAEDALRDSESRYRALVESAPMCIHEIGMDGRITSMNRAGLAMMGVEEECKVQGFLYLDAVCDADRERIGKLLDQAYAGDSSYFEFKASGPDGPVFKSCFVPIKDQDGRIIKLMGITEDITERKRAEGALREKEERLALATVQNGVGVWDWNLVTQEMIWDDSMFALYHIRREDFIGTEEAWRASLHPDDLARGDQEVADAIAGIKPFETEFRVVWPDGEVRHIKAVAKVFRDGQGKPLRMLGINMDITERKQAEELLREKERHARSLLRLSRNLELAQNYGQVIEAARAEVQEIIGYRSLWVYLLSDDGKFLKALAAGGTASDYVMSEEGTATLPIEGDRMLEEIAAAKEIVVVEDARTDPRTNKEIVASMANRTIVNVPIVFLDKHLGSVGTGTFGNEGVRAPSGTEQEYLRTLASHMAVTLDRIHLMAERNKAEAELRELNADFVTLLENTGDFIYFKDRDSRIIFCSQTLAGITGHKSWRDMVGKHDLEIFPPDTARIYYEEELPIFREGKPLLNKTDPYYDERGRRRWVNTNKWPVFGEDGKTVVGIFGISRDITELKEAEDKLNELNQDLERRVADRTSRLEAANQELEAFSYSVSHDLRTPLRAIDGFSRILQDEYGGKFDEEGKHLIDVVRDNATRMGLLIDDILQFSRSGRMELNFAATDMEALAHEVLDELLRAAPEPKLQVEIGHVPQASGDRAMLRQVFVNLLSNAIKFSHNKEAPRVEVGGGIEGGEAVYYVKDNGAGFNMQYADRLFGVFQRLHSLSEFEGTGIGLAIVKRIITRHGGRMWAEGKVGEGAKFCFSLPVKAGARDAA